MVDIKLPRWAKDLFVPARYKLLNGGRGGGKSWAVASALTLQGAQRPLRVICGREFQKSIQESVHQLLCDSIHRNGLSNLYDVKDTRILGKNNTEFIFTGLARNIDSIKSIEGIDIVWIEEAQTISQKSLDFLRPTIRKSNSELWFTWNPDDENDPIQLLKNSLEIDQEQKAIIRKITWRDNHWFPEELNQERLHCLRTNPAQYNHIWEGDFIASLSEFFKEKDLLIDGQPIETPEYINSVFSVIDTTLKGGEGKDGTGIIYLGYNQFDPAIPLVILDWDLVELEGNLLSTWLKTVYEHIEILSQETKAIHGIAGIFIEDKAVGSILLQDAISDRRDDVFAIDSKLTALGKDKRCILISDVVNSGKVKITQRAYNKTVIFRKISRNHLIKQILSFTPGDKEADKRQDDLLDCFSYGVAIGLKDSLKNVRE